jgi:hypothetical protein
VQATDKNNSVPSGGAIANVSAFNPYLIRTTAPNGLSSGDRITISGVGGATCMNGTWTVGRIYSAIDFKVDGAPGCGAGSGGTWHRTDPTPPAGPGTLQSYPLTFASPCAGTADTAIGAHCSVTTSADALAPGSVKEGARSIWQIGRVEVYDGGADSDADTAADNTLFATQGLFVP